MDSKPWYQSTTLWVNFLSIVAIFLQYLLSQQIVPVEYQELALAVFNFINRLKTSTALTLK